MRNFLSIVSFCAAIAIAPVAGAQPPAPGVKLIVPNGFRKMRPDEVALYTTMHNTLVAAMPQAYQDWKSVSDGSSKYDANRQWADVDPDWGSSYGTCPSNMGVTDGYEISIQDEIKATDDRDAKAAATAMRGLTDYNNPAQVATTLKAASIGKITINIMTNMYAGDKVLNYCGKNTPTTISLPVPATLALKALHTADCPYMKDGHPDMSPGREAYMDNALIFLGKPVTSKKEDEYDNDGQTRYHYTIGFDKTKIGKAVVQNIVVSIKGDAADIDAVIALIDWQKLYALIAK